MPKLFTHIIKCNICGVQTGSIELDRKYFDEATVTDESLGFVDSRCDADIIKHGTFKELVEKAETKMSVSDAETFVKLYKKKDKIEKELAKISVSIDV